MIGVTEAALSNQRKSVFSAVDFLDGIESAFVLRSPSSPPAVMFVLTIMAVINDHCCIRSFSS